MINMCHKKLRSKTNLRFTVKINELLLLVLYFHFFKTLVLRIPLSSPPIVEIPSKDFSHQIINNGDS